MAKTGKPAKRTPDTAKPEFVRGGRLGLPDDEPPARFPEIPELKKRLFLECIATNGPRYGPASRAAGVDPKTSYLWRKDLTDTAFQAAFEHALKLGIERLESEFIRRGFEGVEKPVYQGGRLVGTIREFDTTAGIFMLKALAPERHRERFEHVGRGGGPVEAQVTHVHTVDVAQTVRRLRALTEALAAAPAEAEVIEVREEPATPAEAYALELARRNGGQGGNGNG